MSPKIEEIRRLILNVLGDEATWINNDTDLIETGLIDSVFMMEIVTDMEDRFGIEIDGDDIDPGNFVSISKIYEMVLKYLSGDYS